LEIEHLRKGSDQADRKLMSGKDFSSDFDSTQVSAHKDSVSLCERYAKGGDNADL
jgi:putative membrane protein